jgi:hypothetical protein
VNLLQQCRLLRAQHGYQFVRIRNAAEKVSQCDQSLTISVKPVGVGAVYQPWIPSGEQSGLLTHIAAAESVSLLRADEKLTAFLELEAAARASR